MGDLELFFGVLIVVGVLAGVLVFARSSRREFPGEPISTAGGEGSTRTHRGINSTSMAGEGLGNLPGLLITIAFVFIFLGIFLPRDNQWFLVLFIATEIVAATVYTLVTRRSRKESARVQKVLHEINDPQDR
jgi:hypothetical protein